MTEKLKSLCNEFRCTTNRNQMLMTLAHQCRRDGMDEYDATSTISGLYAEIEDETKHDAHQAEIKRAVENAYTRPTQQYKTYMPAQKPALANAVITRDQLQEWRRLQGLTSLQKEIEKQDVAEKRITTKQALMALFRNADGIVWQGEKLSSGKWMTTADNFRDLEAASKYTTVCTFNDATERTNKNIDKICLMVLELDEPIDAEKKDIALLAEKERREYVKTILTDTCCLLDGAGLKPTTVTFSGSKSYHCLFRLSKPIDVEEFEKALPTLKSAYTRIGADPAVLTASRCTRMPRGARQDEAERGINQRLVYLDAEAEIDFDEYVRRLADFADSIAPAPKEKDIPMPIFAKKGKDGEAVKWGFDCEKWEPFLAAIGIEVILADGASILVKTEENGVKTIVTANEAISYIYDVIERKGGKEYKAHFADLKAKALMADNLQMYMVRARQVRRIKDTSNMVHVPYRNGLLEITRDSITLKQDFGGLDVFNDEKSTGRCWTQTDEKSEFETFLEHACGSMEDAPTWQARKKSIMGLLGYLVSTKKEEVNYINVLLEESATENEGGTGKSIIMESVSYIRKRYFKDIKDLSVNEQRFIWSGLKPYTHYIQLDDAPKDLDVERFFSMATGEMRVERKGKDEIMLTYDEQPKIVMGTNRFLRGTGNSYERRMRFFELSNHYCKTCRPKDEFGHLLYADWDDEEWARFDSFMARCVQFYLAEGVPECPLSNVEEKKLAANMKIELIDFFDGFCANRHGQYVTSSDLAKSWRCWYEDEVGKYPPEMSSKYLMGKIKEYAAVKGFSIEQSNRRINGKKARCIFIPTIPGAEDEAAF